MPGTETFPTCDVLVLSWGHQVRASEDQDDEEEDDELDLAQDDDEEDDGDARRRSASTWRGGDRPVVWEDSVWRHLLVAFGKNVRDSAERNLRRYGARYDRGFDRVLGDLCTYDAYQRQRGRSRLLRPSSFESFGRIVTVERKGREVCLFNSSLRLNTGGPCLPVLRMLDQILTEAKPKLVISVGYAGGTHADAYGGDVVVTTRASYDLNRALAGYEFNTTTFGAPWAPDVEWFEDCPLDSTFAEPVAIGPSPSYGPPPPRPEAPPPARLVTLASLPVATRPLLSGHGFRRPSHSSTSRGYLGRLHAAVDMDAAPVAQACATRDSPVKSAFVLGITVPLLRRFPYDGGSPPALLNAWTDHYFQTFANLAAQNAAAVSRVICDAQLGAAKPGDA